MIKYTNASGSFTGTYPEVCKYLNASLPMNKMDEWREGPWTEVPRPVVPTEDKIRNKRLQALSQSVLIDGNGFRTDTQSLCNLSGAVMASLLDPDYFVNWKTENGFMQLTGADLTLVATCVRGYIQKCFDREKSLLEMVEPSDEEIGSGWPDNTFELSSLKQEQVV